MNAIEAFIIILLIVGVAHVWYTAGGKRDIHRGLKAYRKRGQTQEGDDGV